MDALVRQRSLVPALPCLLHIGVFPQPPQRIVVVLREGLSVLEICRVDDHLDKILVLGEDGEFHIVHGVDNILHAMGEVVKHELAVRLDLLRRERHAVDETHLFEDRRLARVSGTEEEHLRMRAHHVSEDAILRRPRWRAHLDLFGQPCLRLGTDVMNIRDSAAGKD